MATDPQTQMLFNTMSELLKHLKTEKNTFSDTRMGRGGSSNARSARETNQNVEAIAENLKDLHKSFRSGGRSIADHFKGLVKNIDPLRSAFGKLEDAVMDSAKSHTKAYNMAAKATLDYIKSVNGNVDSLKDLTKEYAELTEAVNDVIDNQEDYVNNQERLNKKLALINDKRIKLEQRGFKGAVSGSLNLHLKNLGAGKNPSLSHHARYGVNQLNDQYKAVSGLTKSFFTDMTEKVKTAQADFTKSIENFGKAAGSALLKDAKEIPNFISSRLRYGFESNEFMDAFRMGLSADELNQMRSANRDVINALTGFGKNLDAASTDSLRQWADNAKKVGLVGQEAAQFTSEQMRLAYNTGRNFDDRLNKQLTFQAQVIQQAFGGSIMDASKMIQDYSNQTSNLIDFNKAATAEEQKSVQAEIVKRMQLVKWMGYEIDFIKQQEQQRHNSRYADIGDRIRKGIFSRLASNEFNRQGGNLNAAQMDVLQRGDAGFDLNPTEKSQYAELRAQRDQANNRNRAASSDAARNGGFAAGVGLHMQNQLISDIFQRNAGYDIASGGEAALAAENRKRAMGNISFDDFNKQMLTAAKSQEQSLTDIEAILLEMQESGRGLGSLPGAALAGAIAGGVVQILGALLKRQLVKAALGRMAGQGGGLLARLGIGALAGGGGTAATGTAAAGTAAGGVGLGAAATGTAAVGGAALAGTGIGLGLGAWGRDAANSDNTAYKAVTQILNPVGYSANAISDYFADRNSNNMASISERVSKTGVYSEDDIQAFIKQNQIGKWFTSDAEDAADRESAIRQLQQYASYKSIHDRAAASGFTPYTDAAGGIQRDANGNPIASNPEQPINKLVELTEQQLNEMKEARKEDKERSEQERLAEQVQSKASLRMQELSNTVASQF